MAEFVADTTHKINGAPKSFMKRAGSSLASTTGRWIARMRKTLPDAGTKGKTSKEASQPLDAQSFEELLNMAEKFGESYSKQAKAVLDFTIHGCCSIADLLQDIFSEWLDLPRLLAQRGSKHGRRKLKIEF